MNEKNKKRLLEKLIKRLDKQKIVRWKEDSYTSYGIEDMAGETPSYYHHSYNTNIGSYVVSIEGVYERSSYVPTLIFDPHYRLIIKDKTSDERFYEEFYDKEKSIENLYNLIKKGFEELKNKGKKVIEKIEQKEYERNIKKLENLLN